MFITLLIITFFIALVTSLVVAKFFEKPIGSILRRIVSDELSSAWQRYIKFAIFVTGIAGGVRIWDLEKYINPRDKDIAPIALNNDRWALEVYRTIIETMQSIAFTLLIFFVLALIAYVIVRGFELRREEKKQIEEKSA